MLIGIAACDGGEIIDTGDGEEEEETGLSVEEALPDGLWYGVVDSVCTAEGGGERTYDVNILDNTILRDLSDGEVAGTTLDTFTYTARGAADWLGLDGAPIGACVAEDNVFTCATFDTQTVQEHRTLTFLDGALRWEAEVTLAGDTCTESGDLPVEEEGA